MAEELGIGGVGPGQPHPLVASPLFELGLLIILDAHTATLDVADYFPTLEITLSTHSAGLSGLFVFLAGVFVRWLVSGKA